MSHFYLKNSQKWFFKARIYFFTVQTNSSFSASSQFFLALYILYSGNYFVYIFVAFGSCIVHVYMLHKKFLCLWAWIHDLPCSKLLYILRKLLLHLTASRVCWKLFQETNLNGIHILALNVKEWIFIIHTIISQALLFLSFEVKKNQIQFKVTYLKRRFSILWRSKKDTNNNYKHILCSYLIDMCIISVTSLQLTEAFRSPLGWGLLIYYFYINDEETEASMNKMTHCITQTSWWEAGLIWVHMRLCALLNSVFILFPSLLSNPVPLCIYY